MLDDACSHRGKHSRELTTDDFSGEAGQRGLEGLLCGQHLFPGRSRLSKDLRDRRCHGDRRVEQFEVSGVQRDQRIQPVGETRMRFGDSGKCCAGGPDRIDGNADLFVIVGQRGVVNFFAGDWIRAGSPRARRECKQGRCVERRTTLQQECGKRHAGDSNARALGLDPDAMVEPDNSKEEVAP